MNTLSTRPILRICELTLLALTCAFAAIFIFATPARASIVEDLAQNEADSLRFIQEYGNASLGYFSESQWQSAQSQDGLSAQASLPEKYDLRNVGGKNYVTPVKLQSPWGSCWSFGAIAAAETSILSEMGYSYSEAPLDLSERQLAWFSGTKLPNAETMKKTESSASYASQAGEGVTPIKSDNNPFASPFNTGGTPFYAVTCFAAGIGPLAEEEAPYKNDENMAFNNLADIVEVTPGMDTSSLTNYADSAFGATTPYTWGLPEDKRFYISYELEETKTLPSPAQADDNNNYTYNEAGTTAIKQEILAGRGVHIEFRADQMNVGPLSQNTCMNSDTWSQYTFDQTDRGKKVVINHDVCIVGWDDTWGVDKFNSGTYNVLDANGDMTGETKDKPKPQGPGAWIVKNSWGSKSGSFPNKSAWGIDGEGYFYLSYYDMSITRPESYNFYPESITGTKDAVFINQYDFMPARDVFAMSYPTQCSVANVFSAEDDQIVRTLSVETVEPNTHAKVQLYRLEDGAKGPTDGELLETLEADYAYGGYHRLQTQTKHFMEKNQKFSVVATLSATNKEGKTEYQIPMHRSFSEAYTKTADGAALSIYANAVVNTGESYLYGDGEWSDWKAGLAELRTINPGMENYEYDNFALKAFADESIPCELEIRIVDEQDVYHPGDVIKYQVIVRNKSEKEAIENITVDDSLVDLGTASKVPRIGVGEEVTIDYSYTVTEADAERGSVSNKVTTTYDGVEGMSAVVEKKAICAKKATLSIHRLYNPNSGEHFYTSATPEYNMLIELGWNDEGFGWTAPEESATPVYRLYNANGGEHHFTISADERDQLKAVGWNDEGVGWSSDDAKTTPLLREYNPNAFANNHNFTASQEEHDGLIALGWIDEGVGWYGL